MLVRSAFNKIWREHKTFFDDCSPIRHLFAILKLCKHKGRWLDAKESFREEYKKLEGHYPRPIRPNGL